MGLRRKGGDSTASTDTNGMYDVRTCSSYSLTRTDTEILFYNSESFIERLLGRSRNSSYGNETDDRILGLLVLIWFSLPVLSFFISFPNSVFHSYSLPYLFYPIF